MRCSLVSNQPIWAIVEDAEFFAKDSPVINISRKNTEASLRQPHNYAKQNIIFEICTHSKSVIIG